MLERRSARAPSQVNASSARKYIGTLSGRRREATGTYRVAGGTVGCGRRGGSDEPGGRRETWFLSTSAADTIGTTIITVNGSSGAAGCGWCGGRGGVLLHGSGWEVEGRVRRRWRRAPLAQQGVHGRAARGRWSCAVAPVMWQRRRPSVGVPTRGFGGVRPCVLFGMGGQGHPRGFSPARSDRSGPVLHPRAPCLARAHTHRFGRARITCVLGPRRRVERLCVDAWNGRGGGGTCQVSSGLGFGV